MVNETLDEVAERLRRQSKGAPKQESSQMMEQLKKYCDEESDRKLMGEGWTKAEIEAGKRKQRETIKEQYGTVGVH